MTSMFVETWSKLVSASVAPVVVISASGLLCLAFYNRLAAIVTRLRMVQRERIQETIALRAAIERRDALAARRHRRMLNNLKHQTAGIIGRAHLIRLTLLGLLGTVVLLILSSIFNGLALLWSPLAFAAATFDVAGMLSLLCGVICAMLELKKALDVVELESKVVSELTDPNSLDRLVENGHAHDDVVLNGDDIRANL
jgi:hypothetical protein